MENKKFKLGDTVKAITNDYGITNMKNKWEGVVTKAGDTHFSAKTTAFIDESELGKEYWDLDYDEFELVSTKVATRDDLQFADILILRNGERYVVADGNMYGESGDYDRDFSTIKTWYNDDLTQNEENKEEDIMKLERAGTVIYEREDIREMTVEEISKALGYEVKIVKEQD